jgi:hypothetical protein
MEVNKTPIRKYVLVDWGHPPAYARLPSIFWTGEPSARLKRLTKTISMSESDAHSLNQGFALNHQTRRYVKSEE